ncbi:MAG: hypothetical protein IPH16_00005, partial [Haliscomenobacter sp.]|nr:hypothetical protein [Haliscomenobacter sp.]
MELLPLNRQGVHEAITGVTKKELKDLYLLKFDPASLPNALCEDVLKDKNSSRITPLLQYQLKKLFEKAAPHWDARPKPAQVVISEVHYSPEFRKESLEEMLDQEMALLDRDWGEYRDKGLLLDVLDQYITAQFTAGSRRDEEIFSIYRHVPGFEPFSF